MNGRQEPALLTGSPPYEAGPATTSLWTICHGSNRIGNGRNRRRPPSAASVCPHASAARRMGSLLIDHGYLYPPPPSRRRKRTIGVYPPRVVGTTSNARSRSQSIAGIQRNQLFKELFVAELVVLDAVSERGVLRRHSAVIPPGNGNRFVNPIASGRQIAAYVVRDGE